MQFFSSQVVPLKLYTDEVNFGDLLGLTICKKICPSLHFEVIPTYEDSQIHNLITIGSILKGADTNSVVWGAGFIDTQEYLHSKPLAIHALRGPLTNKKVQMQGLKGTKVHGDPGALVKHLFPENVSTEFNYGLIPHYVDKEDERVQACKDRSDVLIIDPQQEPEKALNQIKSCAYILSSSLHGIICADAFGIPAVQIQLSNKLAGNGFEFLDYFLSCGRRDHEPLHIKQFIDFKAAHKKFENFSYRINCDALLDAFPIK